MPSDKVIQQIENTFTYHAPTEEQIKVYGEIRTRAREYALYLAEVCPESRELARALTHLEDCVASANAAIARNPKK